MPRFIEKKPLVKCRNGEACRYHKANRCNFLHQTKAQNQQASMNQNQNQVQIIKSQQPNPWKNQQPGIVRQNEEPNHEWHTVQHKNRKSLWTCHSFNTEIYSKEASRSHRIGEGMCTTGKNQFQNSLPQQRQSARRQLWCKFQGRCNKGNSCEFKHFEDFPRWNPSNSQY